MQAGVQFSELYPAAMAKGKIVMGGTCDSVGIVVCTLGGCYGPFSKIFGNSAVNMLSARVVLANGTVCISPFSPAHCCCCCCWRWVASGNIESTGTARRSLVDADGHALSILDDVMARYGAPGKGTLVTASKCENPDLFFSLRGGGGGNAGVITEFTVRTHRSPNSVSGATFEGTASTREEFKELLAAVLQATATIATSTSIVSDGYMSLSSSTGGHTGGGYSTVVGVSGQ